MLANGLAEAHRHRATPAVRAIDDAKRARRKRDDTGVGDSIIVSSGSIGDHIQTAKEDEHPNSASAKASISEADEVVFQTCDQIPGESDSALEKAQKALDVVDTIPTAMGSRRTESPEDRELSEPKIESNYGSLYRQTQITVHSMCTDQPPYSDIEYRRGFEDRRHNARSFIPASNPSNDSQSTPVVGVSQNSLETSIPSVPTNSEKDRRNSATLPAPHETEQISSQLWNALSVQTGMQLLVLIDSCISLSRWVLIYL